MIHAVIVCGAMAMTTSGYILNCHSICISIKFILAKLKHE